ncbi:MAG: cytochrome c [Chlorobiaceae bacterium]|nr:cytochrome c [Chlorobiaceae bacterium]
MQKTLNIRKFAALAVLSLLVVAGCGKKPGTSGKADLKKTMTAADSAVTATKVPYALKEGKRLFSHYCAVCHGETGDGSGQYYGLTPTPANFTDKAFMKTLPDEKLFKAINEGSASVGKSNMCPPWGKSFHTEETEFIVAYIRTLAGS